VVVLLLAPPNTHTKRSTHLPTLKRRRRVDINMHARTHTQTTKRQKRRKQKMEERHM
jgi:hypothetical protein